MRLHCRQLVGDKHQYGFVQKNAAITTLNMENKCTQLSESHVSSPVQAVVNDCHCSAVQEAAVFAKSLLRERF